MQSDIIKTNIRDHFPIFIILRTYSYTSPDKTKITKLSINENIIHTFPGFLYNVVC